MHGSFWQILAVEPVPGERGCESDDEPRGEVERLAEDHDLPAPDHVGQEAEDERADAAPRYPGQHFLKLDKQSNRGHQAHLIKNLLLVSFSILRHFDFLAEPPIQTMYILTVENNE